MRQERISQRDGVSCQEREAEKEAGFRTDLVPEREAVIAGDSGHTTIPAALQEAR